MQKSGRKRKKCSSQFSSCFIRQSDKRSHNVLVNQTDIREDDGGGGTGGSDIFPNCFFVGVFFAAFWHMRLCTLSQAGLKCLFLYGCGTNNYSMVWWQSFRICSIYFAANNYLYGSAFVFSVGLLSYKKSGLTLVHTSYAVKHAKSSYIKY